MSQDQHLVADHIAVTGQRGPLLPPTSLTLCAGEVRAAVGDPGHGHTALALALAGRLRLDEGLVTLTDSVGPGGLQAAVALVDVPGVSEPDPGVPFATVIGEELAMSGARAGRKAVRAWLGDRGLGHLGALRAEDVPGPDRVRALAELAAGRPSVRFLVLTLPERHGGTPDAWMPALEGLAAQGYGVLVTVTHNAAVHLGVPATTIGSEEDA